MTPLPLTTRWRTGQIKNVADVTLGKMLQSHDTGGGVLANYMRAANVQPDGVLMLEPKQMWFSTSELDALTLRRGDVVVVEGGIGGYGRAAYLSEDLFGWGFQNSINRLRPTNETDGRFLTYYLIALRGSGYIERYCNVVSMPHLTAEKLGALPVPMPEHREQRAIANFLDEETSRIDRLIAGQQRLIGLLLERRQSLIARTLLRGQDGGVELRASGDSRLGDIPAHWRLVPTRYLCTVTTGSEDSGNATSEGEYPFYVRGREILRIGHYSFDGEAVMTPGDGQGGTGKVFHYFSGRFEAHQRVYVFKDFTGVLGRYFYFYLSTFLQPVALAGSNTVTMESLRRPVLADFAVALPPIGEQAEIISYLEEQTAKIDELIAETEKFIALSRERRSALIAATVTGEIDIREAQA